MEMPKVNRCDATQCAYNRERACHALAITVGDADHAHCDTYVSEMANEAGEASMGAVGACKMSNCGYNMNLECHAQQIDVGFSKDEADCLTFEPS